MMMCCQVFIGKHLKAFWTFVNTLVSVNINLSWSTNWVSQRPWSQFEFNLTRGSKVSLQPHWRRLPPRVSVLSQERSSRQSQHSTALHKHTQETLVNKSFHFFPLSHYGVGDMAKISYHIWFFFSARIIIHNPVVIFATEWEVQPC